MNNEFPKYEPKERKESGNDSNSIFQEWKEYLDIVSEYDKKHLFYLDILPITMRLDSCINLLKTTQYTIPYQHISCIDDKLKSLQDYYSKKDFEAIKFTLQDIYVRVEYLEINIKTNNLSNKNTSINMLLKQSEETYKKSLNILQLSNLTGLAAEFELQYKRYNKERICWFIMTLSLLGTIMSKLFEFAIEPVNFLALTMYLCLTITIILYLNDTLIDDLIKLCKQIFKKSSFTNKDTEKTDSIADILNKNFNETDDTSNSLNKKMLNVDEISLLLDKIKKSERDPSKYTNLVQYIFTFITAIFFICIYSKGCLSSLKLFSVNLTKTPFNTWQEFIPHLSIYIPIIWLLWFAIKQYHYTTKLMNAYRFKMTLSLVYHGYKKECEELLEMAIKIQNFENNKQQKQPLKDKELEYKEYLLKNVLKVISEDPTKRDFQDTHMPWSEIKDVVRIFKSGK